MKRSNINFFLVAPLIGGVLNGCSGQGGDSLSDAGNATQWHEANRRKQELEISQQPLFRPFVREIAFAPNGKMLAILRTQPYRQGIAAPKIVELFLIDAAKQSVLGKATTFQGADEFITWSRDGKRLATCGPNAQVWRVGKDGKLSEIARFSPTTIANKSGRIAAVSFAPGQSLGARVVIEESVQDSSSQKTVHLESLDAKSKRVKSRLVSIRDDPSSLENVQVWPAAKPSALFLHSSYKGKTEIGSERFQFWDLSAGKRLWEYKTRGLELEAHAGRAGRDVIITKITGSHWRESYPLHETHLVCSL